MGITLKVLIVCVLLASTSLVEAEQEIDLKETREAESSADVLKEERTTLETNVKDQSQTVLLEYRLDEATESEAYVRSGSDSAGDKVVKRSSSEQVDDVKDFDQSKTGDEDVRQVPAELEVELSPDELKTENRADKAEDMAVNDDQKSAVATDKAELKADTIDENFKTETQEEKSALTESALESKKADFEVDSHDVEMTLRNAEGDMTSINDESKVAEDRSDSVASVTADFLQGTRRMLSAGNHEIIDSKARSEEQFVGSPDVFSAVLNAPNAALNGFNEFGSRRNYPNELSISPPYHQPASPSFLYNLPTYAIHTPASTLKHFTVPEVNSFMPERRHHASETTTEHRHMNPFGSDHGSNSYPYVAPSQVMTQKPNTNPPPFNNIFSKLAKASVDTNMRNYPTNFYKPFDPNFNVQNYNPYNAHRRRRFTVPDSTVRRVIYHHQYM